MALSGLLGGMAGLSLTAQLIGHEAAPAAMLLASSELLVTAVLLLGVLRSGVRRKGDAPSPDVSPEEELTAAAEHLLTHDRAAAFALVLCGTGTDPRAAEAVGRMKSLLPAGAMAAAWSADRIAILLPEASDPMEVMAVARDVTAGLSASLGIACHSGIALGPQDGSSLAELLRGAELALDGARRGEQPGYGFFTPELAAAAGRQQALQKAVANAIPSGSLRLAFQPIHAMQSGALTGFEALIRLDDAELGLVPPSEFIPLAEQSGHIVEIGQWTLDEACRAAALWPPHLVVAVNLSPAEILSGTIVNTVRRALERHALPAYRLEIEITEGTLMTENELVLSQLKVLRDMGVSISLDDFGTGYSSLSYLCMFPFSKLKIDRSFVSALDVSAQAKPVLRAIVKLGHALGLTVTAEGIETQRQMNLLRSIGCDLAQGYLLGRPAPETDLAAIVMRNFAEGLSRKRRDGKRPAA